MSFEEEWAAAHADARARIGMRVNGAPAGPGGSGADLRVRQDKLGEIGGAAYDLHRRLQTDGNHAKASTSEAATMMTTNNFQTGAALRTVHDTWDSQLRTLINACAHISNHLDYSAATHAKDDEEVKASLSVSKISEYFQ